MLAIVFRDDQLVEEKINRQMNEQTKEKKEEMLLSLIQNSENGTEAKSDEYSRAGKRRVIQKKKKERQASETSDTSEKGNEDLC